VVVVGLIHQQHWFLALDLACEAKKEIAERDVCGQSQTTSKYITL